MSVPEIMPILEKRLKGRVLIAGVGNPDSGDDGAGVSVVDNLSPSEGLTLLPVGGSPEFYLSEIFEDHPDVVMYVDAADLGTTPGSVAIIERDQLPRSYGNTHQPPLSTIMDFVAGFTGADTFLLAIQPRNTSCGGQMTAEVWHTIRLISGYVNRIVTRNNRLGSVNETR